MKKRKITTKSKLFQWQLKCKEPNQKCGRCGEMRDLSVDHIVPFYFCFDLLRDREFLHDFEENFQILCRYCNTSKSSKVDPTDRRTYVIIRKLLEKSENYLFPKND